jgi:hypothetical protein
MVPLKQTQIFQLFSTQLMILPKLANCAKFIVTVEMKTMKMASQKLCVSMNLLAPFSAPLLACSFLNCSRNLA